MAFRLLTMLIPGEPTLGPMCETPLGGGASLERTRGLEQAAWPRAGTRARPTSKMPSVAETCAGLPAAGLLALGLRFLRLPGRNGLQLRRAVLGLLHPAGRSRTGELSGSGLLLGLTRRTLLHALGRARASSCFARLLGLLHGGGARFRCTALRDGRHEGRCGTRGDRCRWDDGRPVGRGPGELSGPLVPDPGRDDARGDERSSLQGDGAADRRAATAEERRERGRDRHERKRLEGLLVRALAPSEALALLALPQVRAQRRALRPREPAV